MKKILQIVTTGFAVFAFFAVVQSSSVHAANLTVATGNDENIDNTSCSLTEAIENINDQVTTNVDCLAGNGVNDTINIPAGTINLTADLPTLIKTANIVGAGMGQTIIDGDGQYQAIQISATASETLEASDFTVRGFRGIGLGAENSNLSINRVEVDGINSTGASSIALVGFGAQNTVTGSNTSASIRNSYVHRLNGSVGALGALGIFVYTADEASMDLSLSDTTINSIENTHPTSTAAGLLIMGGIISGGSSSNLTSSLENITITGIRGNSSAIGLGVINYTGIDNASSNVTARNMTITDIKGGNDSNDPAQGSAGLLVGGGGAGVGGASTVSLVLSNTLLSNIFRDGSSRACGNLYNYGPLFSGIGTFNGSIISNGGNLSDDATCSSYFSNPKDQNNLTFLGSTLSPLNNNGGLVPTQALLRGSPAIDSGVTLAGLTQDARGSVRPQGLAYDSGAYESPFTTAQSSTPVTQATQKLADTGESRRIFILCAVLVVLTSLSVIVAIKRQKKPEK